MPTDTCPACGNSNHLCSPREAHAVYDTNSWRGNMGLLEVSSAEVVCAWCKAIRINGDWTRFQTVDSRAQQLSREGNKTKAEYRDSLTAGELNV